MSFLPGCFPLAVSKLTSISLRTTTTSKASTIVIPASTKVGDLIVLQDYAESDSGAGQPPDVTPATFTQVGTIISAAYSNYRTRVSASYKKAIATDPGATITGLAAHNGNVLKCMAIFSPNKPILSVGKSAYGSQETTGNPALQTIACGIVSSPVIAFGVWAGAAYQAGAPVRTMAPAKDAEINTSDGDKSWLYFGWKIYNAAASDVTVDMADEGYAPNLLCSYWLSAA